jgi:hypothetical protein
MIPNRINLLQISLIILLAYCLIVTNKAYRNNSAIKSLNYLKAQSDKKLKYNELQIQKLSRQRDSISNLLQQKKVEYIYITQKETEIIKTYNYEKDNLNRISNASKQYSILSANLKKLDSLDRSGYFNYNQEK